MSLIPRCCRCDGPTGGQAYSYCQACEPIIAAQRNERDKAAAAGLTYENTEGQIACTNCDQPVNNAAPYCIPCAEQE